MSEILKEGIQGSSFKLGVSVFNIDKYISNTIIYS